jgi:hypothetical protein
MKYLEGKFVLVQEPESYRTGQIVKVSKGAALVQYDQMHNPSDGWSFPMDLVCIEEMTHSETERGKVWGFFESRERLEAYLNWMNTPQGDQSVVRLVPKR